MSNSSSSSNADHFMQSIIDYVDSKFDSIELSTEGIVTEVLKNGKEIRVKPVDDNTKDKGHIMRYAMPLGGDGVQNGSMPPVGARVMILFQSVREDDKWESCIAFGGLFDKKRNLSPDKYDDIDADAKADQHHFVMQPTKNGSKMEIYKDKMLTTATKDYYTKVAGKKVFLVDGGGNSKIIHLGEDNLGDDYFLVTRKHLDLYDNLLSELSTYVSKFRTMTLLGDLGIPLPFAVRNTGTYEIFAAPFEIKLASTLKEDGKNKTAKVKGK